MLFDLTCTIEDKMMVYPDDRTPLVYQTRSIEKDGYTNYMLESEMHTGTHIDGPLHMIEGKEKICDADINSFIGKACIIDCRGQGNINWKNEYEQIIKEKEIVLLMSGFDEFRGTEKYLNSHPVISQDFAAKLCSFNIKMIGLDFISPDKYPYHVHKTFMKNNILIAENLTNLNALIHIADFEVIAFPLKINADSAFARVIARTL